MDGQIETEQNLEEIMKNFTPVVVQQISQWKTILFYLLRKFGCICIYLILFLNAMFEVKN